jgi:hypothetical protein
MPPTESFDMRSPEFMNSLNAASIAAMFQEFIRHNALSKSASGCQQTPVRFRCG